LKFHHYYNQPFFLFSHRYERIKFELAIPPTARQFLQTHSVAYPAKILPGYPTPVPTSMAPNNWPFFIPNQQPQQTISPVVLIPHQTAPASVNSYEVNNLIMSSQQKPQSLMTSDELNRKVDQQIKQHWFLLDERQPSASPILSNSFTTQSPSHSHPYHHHHSHSTSTSPDTSAIKKKNVCFTDTSSVRRHSVDDLDLHQEPIPLKSCLKSSITTTHDERQSPIDSSHHVHTQTILSNHKPRPKSAVVSSDIYRSSAAPAPIEHWHTRQLKSAPSKLISKFK
jgi:hypothetical protein